MQPMETIQEHITRAENGAGAAQYNLACDFYNGHGVDKNYAESARWMRRAARGGDDHAQYTLGLMYQQGIGVRKSILQVMRWWGKAARQGNTQAAQGLWEIRLPWHLRLLQQFVAVLWLGYVFIALSFPAIAAITGLQHLCRDDTGGVALFLVGAMLALPDSIGAPDWLVEKEVPIRRILLLVALAAALLGAIHSYHLSFLGAFMLVVVAPASVLIAWKNKLGL